MRQTFKALNFKPETIKMIKVVNSIIETYRGQGYRLTLRQLYYQLVSKDLIENTVKSYNRIGDMVGNGRLAGLIDWEGIEDRSRNLQSRPHWQSPTEIIDSAARSFAIDRWAERYQKYRPYVLVEKEALAGVVARPCYKLDIPYMACKGYMSLSELHDLGKTFALYKRYRQTPFIIHLGDHDPSGIDMTRDIEERLSMFGEFHVRVKRIALNFNQVEEYQPPPNPAKQTDSRFESYQMEYGDESWELDALEPSVLDSLITEAILEVRDEDRWKEATQEQETQRGVLNAVSENWEIVKDYLEENDMIEPYVNDGDTDEDEEED